MHQNIKFISSLESYLSEITGKRITAESVDDFNSIFKWGGYDKFQYFIGSSGNIEGIKLFRFGKKLNEIPQILSTVATTLKYLNLSSNYISNLDLLYDFKALTEIDLSGNQLNNINLKFNFSSIRVANFSYNKIEKINFSNLYPDLKILNLRNNRIIDASGLTNFQNLVELDLRTNQIYSLDFLNKLTSLEKLYLGGNKISDLAPIRSLFKIKVLGLNGNNISNIDALDSLKDVEELYLSSNQIKCIAPVKALPKLRKLYCNNNKIEKVEQWITKKDWFKANIFRDNPIETPPYNVVLQGRNAVRRWFNNQETNKEIIGLKKIVVVGAGKSGKTTLLNKIKNPDFVPNPRQTVTHGINLETDLMLVTESGIIGYNIWDFGGQYIQYYLHQFFISSAALYVIVSDARKDDDQFNYWFRVISQFGGANSKILVVFNKKDNNLHIDPYAVLNRYRRYYRDLRIESALIDLKEGSESVSWRSFIEKFTNLLSSDLPDKKFNVRLKLLDKIRELDAPYIKRSQFQEILAKDNNIQDFDIEDFLFFLNSTGLAVYHDFTQQATLKNYIFLDPMWLVDAIYAPLKVLKSTDSLNNAVVSIPSLMQIWEDMGYKNEEAAMFIDLLQENYFDIAFKTTGNNLIIPSLLQQNITDLSIWEALKIQEQILILDFEDFLPDMLIIKFIVRFHMYIARDTKQNLIVGKEEVLLKFEDNSLALIETHPTENKIFIRTKSTKEDKRSAIKDRFEELYKTLNISKGFNTLLPCYCDKCRMNLKKGNLSMVEFFNYEDTIEALKLGDTDDKCRKSRSKIDLVKLVYGFDIDLSTMPQQVIQKFEINISGNNNQILQNVKANDINMNNS